jgi:diacylglycerol kinase family enzyme
MAPENFDSSQVTRIGILTNPLSGTNRKRLDTVLRTIGELPQALHHNVQTPSDVHNALVDFADQDVDLVVISGGDGTVQAVLTVLFHQHPFAKQPQLMVLEAGTTNMIAGDVGVLGNQNQALSRLFQWVQTGSGKVTKIQRPIIRLQIPGHEVKCGMFFGAGAISQGIQYYHKNLHNKGLRGFPGICLTLGRYLWAIICKNSHSTTAFGIEYGLNGQPLQKENFLLLFVSTLDRLFFGLRPFWGEEKGPLRFTAARSPAKYLLRVLPSLARGRRTDKGTLENGYYSNNVDEVKLFLDSPVALDGEIYTPESIHQPTVLQCAGTATFLLL